MKGYLIVNGYLDNHRFTILYEMLKEAFNKQNINLDIITNKDILQIISTNNIKAFFQIITYIMDVSFKVVYS